MTDGPWLRRPDRHFLNRCNPRVLASDITDKERRKLHRFVTNRWVKYLIRSGYDDGFDGAVWEITPRGVAKLVEPPPAGRCTCVNPKCGRTWKDTGGEVICNSCFKLVPELRAAYRALWAEWRKAERSWKTKDDEALFARLRREMDRNWREIREAFRQEERPDGMEAFMREIGLMDGEDYEAN